MKAYTLKLDSPLSEAVEKLAHLGGMSPETYIVKAVKSCVVGDFDSYVIDIIDVDVDALRGQESAADGGA